MMKSKPAKTVDDYMKLPQEHGVELIWGELLVSPSPNNIHQRIIKQLLLQLNEAAERAGAGEVILSPMDVVLSTQSVVQPDLMFVSKRRSSIIRDKVYGAPDLAIEVVSEFNVERDIFVKRDLYSEHGVAEYWIVDPSDKTIQVYRRGQEGLEPQEVAQQGGILTTPLIPGLNLEVSKVFM